MNETRVYSVSLYVVAGIWLSANDTTVSPTRVSPRFALRDSSVDTGCMWSWMLGPVHEEVG